MQRTSNDCFKGGLAVIACLAMPLSACTHVLADRDWNPHVRPSDCEVHEVQRDGMGSFEAVHYYDAHGRLVSMAFRPTYDSLAWWNFQYDARGRSIAIITYEDYKAIHSAVAPMAARREIDRIDLERDSSGRLRRRRHTHDEYRESALERKEYVGGRTKDDVTEYAYDDAGRLSTVGSSCSPGKLEYDTRGRPVRLIAGTASHEIAYDAEGRIAGREVFIHVHRFHYDGQNRVSRLDVLRGSDLVEYDTWEYGAHGEVTRKLIVEMDPARKIWQETERLYFYDEAGRLRETRFRGELDSTYGYTGKCDEVRNGPKAPSPMEVEGCVFSPYGVLQGCE